MDATADPSSRRARDIDAQIGARLRSLRHQQGMSMEALAHEIALTYQQVQKYETGANRISVSMLLRIARALRTDPCEFLLPFHDVDADGRRAAEPATGEAAVRRAAATLSTMEPLLRQRLCDLIETMGNPVPKP